MRKISFLLFVGFLSINILQCKGQDNKDKTKDDFNSKNNLYNSYNKDTIMLYNILQEQLKYGHPQYDDLYTPYDYSERDYTIILPYIKDILEKNGYRQISQNEFKEKVKLIFNRILDYNNSNKYIYVNFLDKCNDKVIFQQNDIIEAFGVYVNKDLRCISDFYAIPEILDYQNIKGIKQYELNLSNKQKTRDGGEIRLDLWKDEENLSQQRHFNHQLLINRNKYLFNDSKASLAWLKVNDEYFLESLVTTFGYTKDKDLLDWVMQRNRSKAVEFINNYVFVRNCKGELEIREDILKYIEQKTTDEENTHDYAKALYHYEVYENPNKWTEKEAYKILAYKSNTYDYLFMKYKNIRYNNRWNILGSIYYYSNRGDEKEWKEIEKNFEKNNYYNLPHLKEALEYAYIFE